MIAALVYAADADSDPALLGRDSGASVRDVCESVQDIISVISRGAELSF